MNSQSPTIAEGQSAYFSWFKNKFPRVVQRSEPSGFYNCHGLVFASRRAEIYSVREVHKILNEDCYSEIMPQATLPGDVILYFDHDGDIEHSGIVVSEPIDPLRIPMVVSKWGTWCEVIHSANDCPYTFINAKYYRVTV